MSVAIGLVIVDVLSALNSEAFQLAFTQWLAMDGKTLRRSHDRTAGLGALHSVSVWATEFGLSSGQVATDEKSNEITAIPQLLRQVDIAGAIITIDAMGTQTAIARQITESGGDFVLALKGNHETLFEGVKAKIDLQTEPDFAEVSPRCQITKEPRHDREETRVVVQLPAPETLPGLSRWRGLKTIGLATRFCVQSGHETTEERCSISSLPMGVKRFA
ncbi:ISAs1 family transposase [Thalassoroseus pseudoceratinae]|uniref:ISAs1 family transposase n=1 Tax=Thalassoroseus pseudoceratinae TaxID=2713176 RepID=UPI0014207332|nr:ISAs1 family transposase [Thalassoroseus pseudoceratinae]